MSKRNTKAKLTILETLKEANSPVSQDILLDKLGHEIDRATIYRVLNGFYEDKIVHKIIGDDGKQYFAICSRCSEKKHRHNHFHFRCLQCGKIECLGTEIEIKLPKNYRAINFNGFISGYCSMC